MAILTHSLDAGPLSIVFDYLDPLGTPDSSDPDDISQRRLDRENLKKIFEESLLCSMPDMEMAKALDWHLNNSYSFREITKETIEKWSYAEKRNWEEEEFKQVPEEYRKTIKKLGWKIHFVDTIQKMQKGANRYFRREDIYLKLVEVVSKIRADNFTQEELFELPNGIRRSYFDIKDNFDSFFSHHTHQKSIDWNRRFPQRTHVIEYLFTFYPDLCEDLFLWRSTEESTPFAEDLLLLAINDQSKFLFEIAKNKLLEKRINKLFFSRIFAYCVEKYPEGAFSLMRDINIFDAYAKSENSNISAIAREWMIHLAPYASNEMLQEMAGAFNSSHFFAKSSYFRTFYRMGTVRKEFSPYSHFQLCRKFETYLALLKVAKSKGIKELLSLHLSLLLAAPLVVLDLFMSVVGPGASFILGFIFLYFSSLLTAVLITESVFPAVCLALLIMLCLSPLYFLLVNDIINSYKALFAD